MIRTVLIVLILVLGTSLHVPSHRGEFSTNMHDLTHISMAHMEEYTQSTIQSHLDLLANELSLL